MSLSLSGYHTLLFSLELSFSSDKKQHEEPEEKDEEEADAKLLRCLKVVMRQRRREHLQFCFQLLAFERVNPELFDHLRKALLITPALRLQKPAGESTFSEFLKVMGVKNKKEDSGQHELSSLPKVAGRVAREIISRTGPSSFLEKRGGQHKRGGFIQGMQSLGLPGLPSAPTATGQQSLNTLLSLLGGELGRTEKVNLGEIGAEYGDVEIPETHIRQRAGGMAFLPRLVVLAEEEMKAGREPMLFHESVMKARKARQQQREEAFNEKERLMESVQETPEDLLAREAKRAAKGGLKREGRRSRERLGQRTKRSDPRNNGRLSSISCLTQTEEVEKKKLEKNVVTFQEIADKEEGSDPPDQENEELKTSKQREIRKRVLEPSYTSKQKISVKLPSFKIQKFKNIDRDELTKSRFLVSIDQSLRLRKKSAVVEIRSLNLEGQTLKPDVLLPLLEHQTCLQSLNLSDASLGDALRWSEKQLLALATHVVKVPELCLCSNNLPPLFWKALGELVAGKTQGSNCVLSTLDASFSKRGSLIYLKCHPICSFLEFLEDEAASLNTLRVESSDLGPSASTLLYRVLQRNRRMEVLDLARNPLGQQGGTLILRGLYEGLEKMERESDSKWGLDCPRRVVLCDTHESEEIDLLQFDPKHPEKEYVGVDLGSPVHRCLLKNLLSLARTSSLKKCFTVPLKGLAAAAEGGFTVDERTVKKNSVPLTFTFSLFDRSVFRQRLPVKSSLFPILLSSFQALSSEKDRVFFAYCIGRNFLLTLSQLKIFMALAGGAWCSQLMLENLFPALQKRLFCDRERNVYFGEDGTELQCSPAGPSKRNKKDGKYKQLLFPPLIRHEFYPVCSFLEVVPHSARTLGEALSFNPLNPSGFYSFNLSPNAQRKIFLELLQINKFEILWRKSLLEYFFYEKLSVPEDEKEGFKELFWKNNYFDVSQHGNFSGVRDFRVDGSGVSILNWESWVPPADRKVQLFYSSLQHRLREPKDTETVEGEQRLLGRLIGNLRVGAESCESVDIGKKWYFPEAGLALRMVSHRLCLSAHGFKQLVVFLDRLEEEVEELASKISFAERARGSSPSQLMTFEEVDTEENSRRVAGLRRLLKKKDRVKRDIFLTMWPRVTNDSARDALMTEDFFFARNFGDELRVMIREGLGKLETFNFFFSEERFSLNLELHEERVLWFIFLKLEKLDAHVEFDYFQYSEDDSLVLPPPEWSENFFSLPKRGRVEGTATSGGVDWEVREAVKAEVWRLSGAALEQSVSS